MNKQEFLEKLRQSLSGLKSEEINEIVSDQEEYIREAVLSGRNEEEVILSLGNPKAFAHSLLVENKIQKVQDSSHLSDQISKTMGMVIAVIAVAPLNLIFVLGPFIAIVTIILTGWGTSLGILGAAIAGLVLFLVKMLTVTVGLATHFAMFFFILGTIGVAILSFIAMFFITKFFIRLTINYCKWNISFIKGRA